ncbi:MAG: hypothetical protein PWR01_4705 [Clostridiales bacterium]|nr:hypothetical protein [Clostridiales bacterium]MDN5283632.1 hypothetical protein [Candidatus Ozemobacter sp.]
MFGYNHDGWHYFSQETRKWQSAGSKQFSADFSKKSSQCLNLTQEEKAGMLPAFSGSKILCVGRNYRKHAAELGNDVPARPLWFSKPPSAIIGPDESVIIPENAGRIDYEGELVLLIGRRCRNIEPAQAAEFIGGVTFGFDMTARELQRSDGQWTRAKGFDTFLPLASVVAPYSPAWKESELEVRLNGEIVQKSSLRAMVFGFEELVADISACMTLEPGDLIMTGTPEGVGPVKTGDRLEGSISGPCRIDLAVSCR